jgi:hypothetical protein
MHLNLDEWLTVISVLAILLSPIFALEVQKRLDDWRDHRERKMKIVRTLMTTRSTQMAPAHVEALNGIEVEFYAKSGPEKKVLDAWRLYVTHLNQTTATGDALQRWVEKKNDLMVDLLYEMAKALGYDIDKVAIQKNVYYPKGFWDIETEQHGLRKAALAVFSGERPVMVTTVGPVEVSPPLELPKQEPHP